jgi:predicted nucleotidyltransferase
LAAAVQGEAGDGGYSRAAGERFQRMEAKLTELVDHLKSAARTNLKTVILYGSAVTGEFLEKHSDLNILCILERAGAAELERLHPAAEWWTREGHPAPLLFTLEELRRSADIFSIELLDIKWRHRILYGEDFLEQFDVPLDLHRLQVERELRTDWLRLRQAILVAPMQKKAHLGIMLASISAFCALFRHALFALGQPMPENKRAAVDAVAVLSGANPSAFHVILDLREGKCKEGQIDIEPTLQTYLEFVEVITADVDRRLEAH